MKLRVLAGVALLLAARTVGAETGAAAGSGRSIEATEGTRVAIEDTPGHELALAVRVDAISTSDRIAGVSFDGARFRAQMQSDMVDGVGLVRGYGTWEARSGEKLFVMFGYTVNPPAAPAAPKILEGTLEWIGGTGALTKVHGKGSLEGEVTPSGAVRYKWSGSYERGS